MGYARCAQRAQQRSGDRREGSLTSLAMPDGRWIWFDKAARASIPRAVIEEIRWVVCHVHLSRH